MSPSASRPIVDQSERQTLESIRKETAQDMMDLVAMFPQQVRVATEVFSDCDAYVYVSSAIVYAHPVRLPSREGDLLNESRSKQATDDSGAS